jgi:hypothetical protein
MPPSTPPARTSNAETGILRSAIKSISSFTFNPTNTPSDPDGEHVSSTKATNGDNDKPVTSDDAGAETDAETERKKVVVQDEEDEEEDEDEHSVSSSGHHAARGGLIIITAAAGLPPRAAPVAAPPTLVTALRAGLVIIVAGLPPKAALTTIVMKILQAHVLSASPAAAKPKLNLLPKMTGLNVEPTTSTAAASLGVLSRSLLQLSMMQFLCMFKNAGLYAAYAEE